jgi:hypothetical protein
MPDEPGINGGGGVCDLGIRHAQEDHVGRRALAACKRSIDLEAGCGERASKRVADAATADNRQTTGGGVGGTVHAMVHSRSTG